MTWPNRSPRLRASHALALTFLIMAVVLFGTPGRRDRFEARAQAPPISTPPSTRAAVPRSSVPYPVPPELQGIDLSVQTAEAGRRQERGLRDLPSGTIRAPWQAGDRPARLRGLPRRRPPGVRHPARPHLAAIPRRLGRFRQSGSVVHTLESRVAGVHPVREPRRLAGRPPGLRHNELPRRPGPPGSQEHDDPRRDALECGALQQRIGSVQAGAIRRELQHARGPAAAPDGPATDPVRDGMESRGAVPRPAAAVRGVTAGQHSEDLRARPAATRRRLASPTHSKSPGSPAPA